MKNTFKYEIFHKNTSFNCNVFANNIDFIFAKLIFIDIIFLSIINRRDKYDEIKRCFSII